MFRKTALAACVVLAVTPAWAAEIKIGELTIQNAWSRATPKGADIGVGYLTIHNNGAVLLHEMSIANGVMKMREVDNGLIVPAHGSVTLGPRSYHLMFIGLKQPLVKGQTIKAMLTFEHAGSAEVSFDVRAIGAAAPSKPDDMSGMKMP
jgi:copper(I)-binding protein